MAAGLLILGCSSSKPPDPKPSLIPTELKADEEARRSVAHEFFVRAREQEMRGRPDIAMDFYKISLEYDSLNRELVFLMSEKYRDQGNLNKAVSLAHYGLGLPGEERDVEYMLLGDLYLRKGNLEESMAYFQKALELNGGDRDVLYILLTLYEQADNRSGQITILEQLLPTMEYPERLVEKLAGLYIADSEYGKVAELFQSAWKRTGNNLFAERLASVYESQDEMEKVLSLYRVLYQSDPENAFYRVQIARAYLGLGKLDSALQLYSTLIEEYPEKESFIYAYATILFAQQKYEEAKPLFMKLLSLQPDNDLYHSYLGSTAEMLEDFETAELQYNKALRLNAEKTEYWAQLGYYLMRRDRHPEAIKLFQRMTVEKETTAQAWFLLGMASGRKADHLERNNRREGRLDSASSIPVGQWRAKAIQHLEKARSLDSLDQRILFELGANLERNRQTKQAVEVFKKLIRLDSTNAMAMNYLGYMLVEMEEKLSYAGSLINKALEAEPDNGAYLDSKGWWYYKMKDYQKAREYTERALQTGADDVTIIEHLALILEKLGELENAREQWSLILKLDPYHELANQKLN